MSRFLRRHAFLLVLLALGATLRVLAWVAYRPAILYIDSFRYLDNLHALRADQLNPIGYDLLLRPLLAVGGLAFVAAVQHLAGMAVAVGLYALARRLGARRWVSALAAAPLLLDAYQVQIEQNIMSEVLFEALLLGLLWLLLAKGKPNWRRIALAGLIVGFAVLVRLVGVALAAPFLLYVLAAGRAWRRWRGWRNAGIGLLAMLVVVVPYAAEVKAQTGKWGLTGPSGDMLYGRTAAVADCPNLKLDLVLKVFCPAQEIGLRRVDDYTHADLDPAWPGPLPPGTDKTALAHEFAVTVLKAQWWDVAKAIIGDFAKSFRFTRTNAVNDVEVERWQFQLTYPQWADPPVISGYTTQYDGVGPSVDEPIAVVLRNYQLNGGFAPGTVLGFFALLGLSTLLRRKRPHDPARSGALFAAGAGLFLLFACAVFEFSWRYQLPALVLLPMAGALGFTTLTSPSRRRLAAYPDATDERAAARFRQRHSGMQLSELTVVIAAYNEAGGIGQVLDDMSETCLGLPVDVLVVVDGGTDDTATIAEKHGAYVCVAPTNRGQGAALRLGYHLAAEYGAKYIVTTDGDGQYDNSEMAELVRPLIENAADFVTGSRRLGHEEAANRMRWVGVRVFAWLASLLTLRRITDTSFGFRGMHAELATAVPLNEPQYQSSELLLGVTARGARVLERPMSMRLRKAGKSKKGGSLVYGANYARVMTGTWWRGYVLRRGRKRSDRAA
ncbi:dolichyl-phosphate-mannose-protein mannosyltransferase [Amycolatopsis sulphurea]|uniref:Dolichyl-phosphate-mannose-protein mannosyltransferase n=1 Tax=Amycolatopsis sulphurea TaxID=76022 RepID=A0A2A9FI99_9PSEU|nr:glycosyltransferase family 2 protein [Amycolatopsis sulphurea]PFG50878.1 dolichyl-phosphate-mannose-protein mannosyltransferase [Amycolatopsis sulphurea]